MKLRWEPPGNMPEHYFPSMPHCYCHGLPVSVVSISSNAIWHHGVHHSSIQYTSNDIENEALIKAVSWDSGLRHEGRFLRLGDARIWAAHLSRLHCGAALAACLRFPHVFPQLQSNTCLNSLNMSVPSAYQAPGVCIFFCQGVAEDLPCMEFVWGSRSHLRPIWSWLAIMIHDASGIPLIGINMY